MKLFVTTISLCCVLLASLTACKADSKKITPENTSVEAKANTILDKEEPKKVMVAEEIPAVKLPSKKEGIKESVIAIEKEQKIKSNKPKEEPKVELNDKPALEDEVVRVEVKKPQEKEVKEIPIKSEPAEESIKPKITFPEMDKEKTNPIDPTPTVLPMDHSSFDALLKEFVHGTSVDYNGLKKAEMRLDRYLELLSTNPPNKDWSDNKSLAYWINAYNAFTLKLILNNLPVRSIMDLDRGKPWDKRWIELNGKTYSLNQIEHDIIRPEYKDARIHFAVNCAARSCPPLGNFAYTENNVQSKLELQTKSFINSGSNEITASSIEISKIFEWYKSDFGNLIEFLNKYSNVQIDKKAKLKFAEYDWALNAK